MHLTNQQFADRCRGALLGTAFGDALGAPLEFLAPDEISSRYGRVEDFMAGRQPAGCYTDDTQMMLALARSLARCRGVDAADCARSAAEHFDPRRGYGRSAVRIFEALLCGADYTGTAEMFFAGGSYGNGAAMRIAPLGLLYGAGEVGRLRQQVFCAIRATHVHDEAIDGAVLLAAAVGRLSRMSQPAAADRASFLRQLAAVCVDGGMRQKVEDAALLLQKGVSARHLAETLGNGVRTRESVPTALGIGLLLLEEPEEAVVAAALSGGDTDTIAAMTGAVVGASNGAEAFPQRWHDGLERGEDGYGAISALADELAKLAAETPLRVDF